MTKPPKPPKTPPSDPRSAPPVIIAGVLADLAWRISAASKLSDNASASKAAQLTRLYVQLAAEARKQEAHDRRAVASYTHAGVIQWARALDPTDRSAIVRELQLIDSKRSGLA